MDVVYLEHLMGAAYFICWSKYYLWTCGKDFIDHSTIYFCVLIITIIPTLYLSLHVC